MKYFFNRSYFSYPFFALVLLILGACSDDEPLVDHLYLTIPDSHFETELINLGIDSDGIVNQQLLKSDAEKVSRLDLNHTSHFGEISDLSGIEGFVNLTFLSAAGQEIETIDLSQNIKLDTAFLNSNRLISLDISNNAKLTLLDAQVNEITEIVGLDKATHLKELNLSWNSFENISIANPSLEVLLITHNFLKSIDLSGAVGLTNILMISNQLTSLDLSSNLLLETLVISDNQIPSINLEHNTNLTHLYMSSNTLTGLDVSHNQELIDLRVDRNPDLNCIKILSDQEIPTVSISDYQTLTDSCD